MVKNAINVFARLKPEDNVDGIVNYQIHRRPKKHSEEDFLVLSAAQKCSEYIDNRPESWNFSFHKVFEDSASQDDIFNDVARPVVRSLFEGFNGTVFAYGQTGSGKTYSITGDPENIGERGILPRTLHYLFDTIEKSPNDVYSVELSYLEIYNEYGYDLIPGAHRDESVENLPRVEIQEDQNGKIYLKNLDFHKVKNVDEALDLLMIGDENRTTSETPMNIRSSRSHCIFTIILSAKKFGEDHSSFRAKMHLVDLAGSERVYKCSISGAILTEAKYINLSLHYLEQVIVSLGRQNTSHIPYRNSLLTSILRDSLGGNCITIMLATLSISAYNLEETISTCRFAQRVALIRNDVKLMTKVDVKTEIELLRIENERLRKEINQLKIQQSPGVDEHHAAGYYKDLISQKDEEIALLIMMLESEEKNKNKKTVDKFVETEKPSLSINTKLSEVHISPRINSDLCDKILSYLHKPPFHEKHGGSENLIAVSQSINKVTQPSLTVDDGTAQTTEPFIRNFQNELMCDSAGKSPQNGENDLLQELELAISHSRPECETNPENSEKRMEESQNSFDETDKSEKEDTILQESPRLSHDFENREKVMEQSQSYLEQGDNNEEEDDTLFEQSLPLTGDIEIDEEIIAFYKAKRAGGTY